MILTNENYFSQEASTEFFSVSQYKDMKDCPARAIATMRGEYKPEITKALLIGSYVDAYIEGNEAFEKFKAEHPEIFNSRTGELKVDYQMANTIIDRANNDPLLAEYLSGKKQVIITAEMFGAPWKIKIDSYFPGDKIVDLKVMRSMERIMGKSFVEHWGYDIQMAVYSEVEHIATGKERLDTYLAVLTKEEPSDVGVIHVPAWRRKECLEEVKRDMPRLIAYKKGDIEAPGCGVCPYCRSKKKARVIEFDEVGFSNKELAAINGRAF